LHTLTGRDTLPSDKDFNVSCSNHLIMGPQMVLMVNEISSASAYTSYFMHQSDVEVIFDKLSVDTSSSYGTQQASLREAIIEDFKVSDL
uniref:Vesicle-fusing ATPase n=1 Tax=Angiostrongylus cantonensis TaxID=6313 RepID=A0A0K0DJD1_ANGCA